MVLWLEKPLRFERFGERGNAAPVGSMLLAFGRDAEQRLARAYATGAVRGRLFEQMMPTDAAELLPEGDPDRLTGHAELPEDYEPQEPTDEEHQRMEAQVPEVKFRRLLALWREDPKKLKAELLQEWRG